jgi:hypothetical protein
MSDVISVFTFKSVETILADGGSQSWVLDRVRASRCDYLVCCRNSNNPAVEGVEDHGSAFLVGKVKDVVASDEDEGRWKILISEFAHIDWPDQWSGRNPVAYWKDSDFKDARGQVHDFKALDFQPVDALDKTQPPTVPTGLTIPQAKAGLAAFFNVPESAIEIVIRA